MGNVFRLAVIVVNIVSFIIVKEIDANLFISYLILFNSLAFTVFYYFDFHSPFNRRSKKAIIIENEINDTELKVKATIFKELKYSMSDYLNWVTLIFPMIFLLFVEEHSFDGLDILFSAVIFFHLIINIMILSILIRNYYYELYVLYMVLVGVIFQTYNGIFDITKKNTFWFSVSLIIVTFLTIVDRKSVV